MEKKEDVSTLMNIDVEELIASKNPRAIKFMPRFVINYLKRIIHQDEVNQFFVDNKDNYGLDFAQSSLKTFEIDVKIVGEENIPSDGKFIFVSNHPLGGLESMAFIDAVMAKFSKIKFIVNDILMHIQLLKELFIPVNKHGRSPQDYFKQLDDAFNSEAQILLFPAGLVSRKIKGKIVDLEWKKSFISMSKTHKRDVIPVYIDARNSDFFYNLSNFRKRIGIKANIEMFYLINEIFKQQGNRITLYFGKPISYESFDKTKSYLEWANHVREIAYNLPKEKKSEK